MEKENSSVRRKDTEKETIYLQAYIYTYIYGGWQSLKHYITAAYEKTS